MINLTSQRKRYNLVIGADRVTDFICNCENLVKYGFQYIGILHDCDLDVSGVLKNKHYHLIITNDKKVRASQVLNMCCEIFGCNAENIQLEYCVNLVASIQYLVHLHNENKYQYDKSTIFTSVTKTYLENCLKADIYNTELTTDCLFDIICQCKNKCEIIQKIGISHYAYYRHVINDILDDIRAGRYRYE